MKNSIFPRRCALHSIFLGVLILSLGFNVNAVLSQEAAILKLILNEEDKGEFFVILAPDSDIWIRRDALDNMKLKEKLGRDIQYDGDAYVSLRSIQGLEFRIDEKAVALRITADPSLFRKHSIDISYEIPYDVTYTKDTSAFLNYALIYTDEADESSFDMSGELGISAGDYLGMTTFAYTDTDTGDADNFVRLMTNLTFNDRQRLSALILGDFSALSGTLGSGVTLGGINFSKNFSIAPYFIQYPSLNLSGTLETPSDIEVYLNDLLVRKERLSPGEFLFTDVPATVGLGTASIVIKDAYGREKIISTPYYYTDKLLKKGLHEYSYSIGFLREKLGEKSFSYSNAAFLGFHSFGFTNNFKAGYAAEASEDLINIGPTASISVFDAGVLDTAIALSNSSGESGYSGFLGYSFQSNNIGIRVSLRSNSKEYSNLIIKPPDDKAKLQFSSVAGFKTKGFGSFTAGYSSSNMHIGTNTSRITISYSKPITRNASFFLIASETKNTATEDEIFLGLHIYLGRRVSGNISYTGGEDKERRKISIHKGLPVGSGFGFRADVESSKGQNNINGGLQYQNRHGLYDAQYHRREDTDGYRFSVSGGIGYIGKSIFFSRPINDSFAKVTVGKQEGVRVYYYGNEAGRTNRNGNLIIPNLHSFDNNKISIENRDIPINYNVPSFTKYIVPPYRSGSLVRFDTHKIQGITGTVYLLDGGVKMPIESTVMLVHVGGRPVEGLIGMEGEFYLENIPAGEYSAEITYIGKDCEFDIIIPESDEMFIDLGEQICE